MRVTINIAKMVYIDAPKEYIGTGMERRNWARLVGSISRYRKEL